MLRPPTESISFSASTVAVSQVFFGFKACGACHALEKFYCFLILFDFVVSQGDELYLMLHTVFQGLTFCIFCV